jgi:NAD(P)-dependent dehydrogenase (short-subunit alcohol dehydrogenase family)
LHVWARHATSPWRSLFLASQMSNYVTGQTLNVDGGILMD